MAAEEKLDKAIEQLERFEMKLKKNSHLHILIETKIIDEMKRQAEAGGISLSEWCRRKLGGDSQLDRIEGKLDKFIKL